MARLKRRGWTVRILVACEESQAVTIELRRLGHEAYSCDILPSSGEHREWHIMGDVLPLLNGDCTFCTTDGTPHSVYGKWDMIIAFPACTHLAVSGARHFEQKRKDGRQQQGIDFFMKFTELDCPRVAIENPVGIMSTYYRKPDQIIQPYFFGDHAKKTTCLWLKGLPKLIPTNIVDPGDMVKSGGKLYSSGAAASWAKDENGKIIAWNDPRTAQIRSKTFPGIAKAMAEQWAGQA